MALLDQYGRPVRLQKLTEPLAEGGMTGIRQTWAGSAASGLTPVKLASILRSCDQGELREFLILAEEMEERDPHYFSVLGTRKRAISGIMPQVEPASDSARDVEIAEAVREEIAEHPGFADLVEDLLDALGKGFSVVEIDWARSASRWTPERFDHRDPRFFTFDRETRRELRLLDEAGPVEGVALEPFKFITHRARMKSGLTYRGGLARVVAFGWMCKAYTFKDWMSFIETYGLPLRIGRYDANATKEDVAKLYQAVANIGTDAAAFILNRFKHGAQAIVGTTISPLPAPKMPRRVGLSASAQGFMAQQGKQAVVTDLVRMHLLTHCLIDRIQNAAWRQGRTMQVQTRLQRFRSRFVLTNVKNDFHSCYSHNLRPDPIKRGGCITVYTVISAKPTRKISRTACSEKR